MAASLARLVRASRKGAELGQAIVVVEKEHGFSATE
jgi:hypothetical protein